MTIKIDILIFLEVYLKMDKKKNDKLQKSLLKYDSSCNCTIKISVIKIGSLTFKSFEIRP